jgi:hypothetical protein
MLLCRFLLPDTMTRNADDSPEDDISNVHPSLSIAIPDTPSVQWLFLRLVWHSLIEFLLLRYKIVLLEKHPAGLNLTILLDMITPE